MSLSQGSGSVVHSEPSGETQVMLGAGSPAAMHTRLIPSVSIVALKMAGAWHCNTRSTAHQVLPSDGPSGPSGP